MMETLKDRSDFLRAAKGRRWAMPGLVVQMSAHKAGDKAMPSRVGFTVTKKVGNAVVRNRVKRRLRAVAREVLEAEARPGFDYVLIGRAQTVPRSYNCLLDDLRSALIKLHTPAKKHRSKSGQDRGKRGQKTKLPN